MYQVKLKIITIAITTALLSTGCDSPVSVGTGQTDRDSITQEQALSNAKEMATGRSTSVNIVAKPYAYLARIASELSGIYCNNSKVKAEQYDIKTGYTTFNRTGDLSKYPPLTSFIERRKDYLKGMEKQKKKYPEDVDIIEQRIKDKLARIRVANQCIFMGLMHRAVVPRSAWEIGLREKDSVRGRYMDLRLTEAWHTSRHFGILSMQIVKMKSIKYEQLVDIFIDYISDADVVEAGLNDAQGFLDTDRRLQADMTGTAGVKFNTSDGFIFDAGETGSAQLIFMGSPWLSVDYIEGQNITINTSYTNTVQMSKTLTEKAGEVGAAINETSNQVGI